MEWNLAGNDCRDEWNILAPYLWDLLRVRQQLRDETRCSMQTICIHLNESLQLHGSPRDLINLHMCVNNQVHAYHWNSPCMCRNNRGVVYKNLLTSPGHVIASVSRPKSNEISVMIWERVQRPSLQVMGGCKGQDHNRNAAKKRRPPLQQQLLLYATVTSIKTQGWTDESALTYQAQSAE